MTISSSALSGPPRAEAAILYDSANRGSALAREARDLWAFRHLVVELVLRDIKVRYKRSSLGVAWTMLSPLLHMAALTFAFSTLLRNQIANFPVYLLSGMIFWNFFAQATIHAATLTYDALEITRRTYVPRSVFVLSAVGGALVNLVFALLPLLVIVVLTGHPLHAAWLFLPIPVVLCAAFTAGAGFFVFTLACRFSDVKETWGVLVQMGFFLTPIIYTPEILPERFRRFLEWNPMTHLLEVFRAPIYDGSLPGLLVIGKAALAAAAILAVGWAFYAANIDDFAAAA